MNIKPHIDVHPLGGCAVRRSFPAAQEQLNMCCTLVHQFETIYH